MPYEGRNRFYVHWVLSLFQHLRLKPLSTFISFFKEDCLQQTFFNYLFGGGVGVGVEGEGCVCLLRPEEGMHPLELELQVIVSLSMYQGHWGLNSGPLGRTAISLNQ